MIQIFKKLPVIGKLTTVLIVFLVILLAFKAYGVVTESHNDNGVVTSKTHKQTKAKKIKTKTNTAKTGVVHKK